MKTKFCLVFLAAVLGLAACASRDGTSEAVATESAPRTLRVMTHDSFTISEEVVAQFEAAHHAQVQFLKSGDAGTMLNQAILSREHPMADVIYGVDNTFLSRALQEDIFEPYTSPLLAQVPEEFILDQQHHALPIDYGDVCLNYDIAYFTEKGLQPPSSLEDLLKPEYQDLLVVENPATSSPGLAFLLSTIGHYGTQGYQDYWQGLVENGTLVVNDWGTAYYTEFTPAGGTRPITVSYASSPAAEVIYAEQPIDSPPTAAVTSNGSCFRQIEFAGILKNTPNQALAEEWMDFMLSLSFQEDIPLQMLVYPVNKNAQLNEVFVKFSTIPQVTAQVSPESIAENREQWIREWTEIVLK